MKLTLACALFATILLATIACKATDVDSRGPQQGAPGNQDVSATHLGPTNDESYSRALRSYEEFLDACRRGDDDLPKKFRVIRELNGTARASNFTYDRFRLMDAVATLCFKSGYLYDGQQLREQIADMQVLTMRPDVPLKATNPDRIGFDELARIPHELPPQNRPATPFPPAVTVEPSSSMPPATAAAEHAVAPASSTLATEADSPMDPGASIPPKGPSVEDLARRATEAYTSGDLTSAEAYFKEAIGSAVPAPPPTDPRLLGLQLNLARVQIALNKLAEARQILEDVLAKLNASGRTGESEWYTAAALLSSVFKRSGYFDRAKGLDADRARSSSTSLPEDDPRRIAAEGDLVAMKIATGEVGSGDRRPRGTSSGSTKPPPQKRKEGQSKGRSGRLGEDSVPEDPPAEDIGSNFSGTGDLGDRKAEVKPRDSGDGRPRYSEDDEREENLEDDAGILEAVVADLLRTRPNDVNARMGAREGQARCEESMGNLDRASDLRNLNLKEALEAHAHGSPRVAAARIALARTNAAQGDKTTATKLVRQACATLPITLPSDHPALVEARLYLSGLLEEVGETEAAALLLQQTLSKEIAMAIDQARLLDLLEQVTELQKACQLDRAIALRREALAIEKRTLPPGLARVEGQRELAALLRVAGRKGEARELEREISTEGDRGTELGDLRLRAVEASSRAKSRASYAPDLDLSVSLESGKSIQLTARVRSLAGISQLTVAQDGSIRGASLFSSEWASDPDGLGGRLELSLDVPSSRDISVVTVIVEDAWGGRTIQNQVVQVSPPVIR